MIPNTGMCLMVFEANEEDRKELSDYFEKACSIYDGNIPEILFIAFSKQDNTFFYSYIIKKQEHT